MVVLCLEPKNDGCRCLRGNSRPAPFGRHFERIVRKAKARSFVTRFLGARKDGLRPKTALRLYFSLVRPILEYAAPVLVFGKSHMDKLEALQLGIVKRMLGLRDNTKNESVRVISGVEPIAVRLGFLKLKHQYRILKKPGNSLVKKVYLEVKKQPGREGFHRECEELRDRFGVPLPDDTETPLCAYGRGLKAAMYRQASRYIGHRAKRAFWPRCFRQNPLIFRTGRWI